MYSTQFDDDSIAIARLLNSVWLLSITLLGIGIISETFLALADDHLSRIEFSQLVATTLIFSSWLFFRPVESGSNTSFDANLVEFYEERANQAGPAAQRHSLYLQTIQDRMTELKGYHMISQEYIFPFSYLCQIYHLLNLKHLEEVHSFSLNNLKIVKVSEFQPTDIGGAVRFQTVLESPFNTLRIWRQPLVEVDLILHTPYTVELNIPVYNDKRIAVLFNVLPLNNNEHKLFIDIYSNLMWPKPILQILLHIASCLTVFEDLPYLHRLAERNLERIIRLSKIPNHETMWLFGRFAELYDTAELYGSGV